MLAWQQVVFQTVIQSTYSFWLLPYGIRQTLILLCGTANRVHVSLPHCRTGTTRDVYSLHLEAALMALLCQILSSLDIAAVVVESWCGHLSRSSQLWRKGGHKVVRFLAWIIMGLPPMEIEIWRSFAGRGPEYSTSYRRLQSMSKWSWPVY